MSSAGNGWDNTEQRYAWPNALGLLFAQLRRLIVPILLLMLIFAGLAVFARTSMPQTYRATAELLIDPRGLQVFENELVTGQYDANAAVNYVESQIHVILSTQVLSQALRYAREQEGEPSALPDAASDEPVSSREVEALRRQVSVYRAERSYILSVTVETNDPEQAARLANAVVRAYLDEDAKSRSNVANRLTDDLNSRLAQLRERLAESEARAEEYRRQNNLVSADDRLIVDQQLSAAVTALDQADERLSAARSRHQQILSADPSIVASLAGESNQTRLNALIGRQIAAREEVTRLSMRLGDRHPSLSTARSQLGEVERQIQAELERIRASSAAALRGAEQDRATQAERVAELTRQSTDARGSSIELRTLEEEVRINRELLTSVERRSREMAEFAMVDSANVRLLSTAYPPETSRGIAGVVAWSIAGAILGLMVGLGLAVLRVIVALIRGPSVITERRTPQIAAVSAEPASKEPEQLKPRRHSLLSGNLDGERSGYSSQRRSRRD